ncbi:MAG: SAM-dependent methyltransferase [Methanotrichaceae archaeon]|nr:SAM-dependent methyltransferase [Methanotrichaceae archaeon]MDD1757171.1 SAM-dependent methyltransferase [Methanotrichaceae archaeon]
MPSENNLYIIGIGPGQRDQMTIQALKAIEEAKFIVGHRTYLDLIEDLLERKEIVASNMGQEVERAKIAVDLLEHGSVAIVSSGDPNVYGMAGLCLEVAYKRISLDRIKVVPGITSFTAAACRAGLIFRESVAVISLSDLLTPFSEIEGRLKAAAELKMPVILYNPRSRRRDWQLDKALQILGPEKEALIAINVARKGEKMIWSKTGRILEEERIKGLINMFTVVLINGNEVQKGLTVNKARINVVGLGPGDPEYLTAEAREVLKTSAKLFGPERYLQTARCVSQGEGVKHSGDCQKRMRLRFQDAKAASERNEVSSILTGGDPCIFSAAWRVLEEARGVCDIHISPGISAFSALASKIGAPLVNDFALLSSIKEPSKISRLSEAGFGIVAYNAQVQEIRPILEMISPERPCALARDISREGEEIIVSKASELMRANADGLRFTFLIASHNSFINDDKIITRRGYQAKYCY